MKLMKPFYRLGQAFALTAVLLFVSLPGQTAMVGTAEISRDIASINVDQTTLQQQRLWIQQQLVANGVSAADSAMRVSLLSDAQVRQVRQQFDEMPAGAGVAGIIVTAAIVILVTDLIGLTDVYPFIRPIQ